MTNSEISHNYDDLTDLNGYLGSAMAGPSPNQLYLRVVHLVVGRTFKFYDMTNLALIGTASITEISTQSSTDQSLIDRFNNMEKNVSAGINDASNPIALVTLDTPISGESGLYMADDQQSRPKLFSIRDSYLHDGLAEGIQLKGADNVVATGNVIERAAIACATSGFSGYWLEGGPPKNIYFSNNYCIDSPYSVGMTTPSFKIITDDYALEHAVNTAVISNVTINDNIIVNPQLGGIMVAMSDGVTVKGNTIYNPASVRPGGDKAAYGLSVQTSQNVTLQDNIVHVTNTSAGFEATNMIVANNRTNLDTVKAIGNAVSGIAGNSSDSGAANSITSLDTTDY